jgi:hypothetical protein
MRQAAGGSQQVNQQCGRKFGLGLASAAWQGAATSRVLHLHVAQPAQTMHVLTQAFNSHNCALHTTTTLTMAMSASRHLSLSFSYTP